MVRGTKVLGEVETAGLANEATGAAKRRVRCEPLAEGSRFPPGGGVPEPNKGASWVWEENTSCSLPVAGSGEMGTKGGVWMAAGNGMVVKLGCVDVDGKGAAKGWKEGDDVGGRPLEPVAAEDFLGGGPIDNKESFIASSLGDATE